MLLGSALTLGHGVDLYDNSTDPFANAATEQSISDYSAFMLLRRSRLKRLLFVYISQLASRIGCSIPKSPFHTTISPTAPGPDESQDRPWYDHMISWIDLTRLVRTSSEFLFPSKSVTQELLQSGRYTEVLEHFRPLLEQWLDKYSQISSMSSLNLFGIILKYLTNIIINY
jgi:hypothetical protein